MRLFILIKFAIDIKVTAVIKSAAVNQIAENFEVAAVIKIADNIDISSYVEVESNVLRRTVAQTQRLTINQVKRYVVLAEFQNPTVYFYFSHYLAHAPNESNLRARAQRPPKFDLRLQLRTRKFLRAQEYYRR